MFDATLPQLIKVSMLREVVLLTENRDFFLLISANQS